MDRNSILRTIANEVRSGDISFPTSVQVALKLQRALDDPDCHVDTATQLIRAEPLLSSKVVAMANSVAFNRSGREIADVRTAVSRLGFRTIRSLAAGVVTRQLAGDRSAATSALAARLWEHTTHVAALARVIAARLTHQDPETAMFAGIVHEVGGFYLISRAKDYPVLLDERFSVEEDSGEAEVGRAVLAALKVPDAVVEAIEVLWQGFLAIPPSTLGDTLLLAEELSPVACPLSELAGQAPVCRAASIDMVIGADTLSEILAESAVEVESLASALRV
ncbi:MAG: HDOD domain-containing protein [Azoarcus sp.]|nr:HDOD domain-containing protein [Azoarcus sp.]